MQHKHGPLLVPRQRNTVSNKSDQYVIYLKQCLLSMYYKRITVCLEVSVEFHEIYWILEQFRPILSAKFGIDIVCNNNKAVFH